MKTIGFFLLLILTAGMQSCGGKTQQAEGTPADSTAMQPKIEEKEMAYSSDSANMNAFIAYDATKKGKLPVILIVHEWWGLNDYAKNRAKQLAGLGYFAVALDMYGDGKIGNNPEEAQKLATPFYMNPQLANNHIEAAIEKLKTFKNADTDKMVAIGYCFGGSMVLNAAKSGLPFKGVVSFHGGLAGITPEKGKTKADVLVCHGADDKFVPPTDVAKFKTQMDSVGASYTFKEYAGATHAFTNPESTENGKKFNIPIAYNEKADKASWEDFMAFLDKVLK